MIGALSKSVIFKVVLLNGSKILCTIKYVEVRVTHFYILYIILYASTFKESQHHMLKSSIPKPSRTSVIRIHNDVTSVWIQMLTRFNESYNPTVSIWMYELSNTKPNNIAHKYYNTCNNTQLIFTRLQQGDCASCLEMVNRLLRPSAQYLTLMSPHCFFEMY